MNIIGKIFVFAVFVMSLVFMSFAVAIYSSNTKILPMMFMTPPARTLPAAADQPCHRDPYLLFRTPPGASCP